jgi:multidrug efflux pump subunit AcrA (membrane-fusion protein)
MQPSSPSLSLLRSSSLRNVGALVLALTVLTAACGGGQPDPAPGGAPGAAGGPPPGTPVDMVTLELRPIEDISEYVGTVKSRRSTTIQPQAEGFLRRIAVKSGDRVAAGAVLAEIDNAPQQAAIAAIQSTRAAREADATFARQQAARTKALDEQIRQAQIEMGYYRVTSPVAGIVGDVPVRVGDRVTRQTVLTTVEDNAGLEAYINVPVQDAPRLKAGLTVRLLGENGDVLATERISFVAGVVDDTQTVLAKATLGASATQFRADQFIRARVVWSEAPGLVAPLTSVTRIGGQYFVFVAEPGDGGVLVARMRPVTLGSVIGNDYVVREGLKPGERLITGGIQKIGDGAPVAAGGK